MEATISLSKHDNKENIPPSSTKETGQILQEFHFSSAKNLKRRFRRPLKEITHLFIDPSVQLRSTGLSEFRLQSSISSDSLNCRKRKTADEIDLMHKTCSKILRKEFR